MENSHTENDSVIMIEDDSQDGIEQAMQGGNLDAMLDEFREITKEISKYVEKLKQLNAQEATIRTKIKQHKSDMNEGNFGAMLGAMLDEFSEIIKNIFKNEQQLKQLNAEKAIIREKLISEK